MENTHVSTYNSTSRSVLLRHVEWYTDCLCKFLKHMGAMTGLKMKLKLLKIPRNEKKLSSSFRPPIGPRIMAWIAQPYSQDACRTGSGSFAALGWAEDRFGGNCVKLQCLHQIASTSTLICCPIPPNWPPLFSPPPHTVTINWLLPQIGCTICCCWPTRLPYHWCRTIPVVQLRYRFCCQYPCRHLCPWHHHRVFIVLCLSLRRCLLPPVMPL